MPPESPTSPAKPSPSPPGSPPTNAAAPSPVSALLRATVLFVAFLVLQLVLFKSLLRFPSSRFLPAPRRSNSTWANGAVDDADECRAGLIYVYDLPPEFNHDLVAHCERLWPWYSFCPYLASAGRPPRVQRVRRMRERVVEMIPRLVYGSSSDGRGLGDGMDDALDVALSGVLRRSRRRRRSAAHEVSVASSCEPCNRASTRARQQQTDGTSIFQREKRTGGWPASTAGQTNAAGLGVHQNRPLRSIGINKQKLATILTVA
uniref:Exostosin GT47 domain-containing protein n=1 Tax=Oryza brachyantha TaxID=4533 RepID=J3MDV3_ORYBR